MITLCIVLLVDHSGLTDMLHKCGAVFHLKTRQGSYYLLDFLLRVKINYYGHGYKNKPRVGPYQIWPARGAIGLSINLRTKLMKMFEKSKQIAIFVMKN